MPLDVTHLGPGAKLGISDIEEGGAAGDGAQKIPRGDVGLVVGCVVVERLVVDGHSSVGRHGERPEQLLEVGPMILIVAKGDAQSGFLTHAASVGLTVLSLEADRGRIIMEAT